MITANVHGWRSAGLIAYLFSAGRHEEHHNPRIIAAWHGDPGQLQPALSATAESGFELGPLMEHMEAPARRAGLPVRTPREGERYFGKQGYVWHTSVRLHPEDRTLSDRQWQEIAEHLMHASGIGPRGDAGGCRWIAVRHGDDHIHLMAVLVREDTGNRFWPRNDYRKLRKAADELVARYGLRGTPEMDRTAPCAPTRAEVGKAERRAPQGRRAVPAREQLRRLVQREAASAASAEEFAARMELPGTGLTVRWNDAPGGRRRGYAVALDGDVTAAGDPVWYSGGKLAADLTWPKLAARWTQMSEQDQVPIGTAADDGPAAKTALLEKLSAVVEQARSDVRAAPASAPGIAFVTQELLAVLAEKVDGSAGEALAEAVEAYDRAYRVPHRVAPTALDATARHLRWMAYRLANVGMLTGRRGQDLAVAALVTAIAALLAEVAAWREAQHQPRKAAAARAAAATLERVPAPTLRQQDGTARRAAPMERAGAPHSRQPASAAPIARRRRRQ
ncbi:relaxase/mobilization nuclease domain-containing protein [Solihabitans fulvus]|uniref:Relaxase/mobilization nuclease domain-containing protein n=1 Tax=Solihabitans fulvus TaxID=1892852 RepID=A0A5B2WH12_9PSEU|nr:relaxase/mobilization nuclease domain-containing protein [Solihabitans fulvus]KAA2249549.1 relaxase/mobilization nuclease domain-containing protein [Solihabitans fulvus]